MFRRWSFSAALIAGIIAAPHIASAQAFRVGATLNFGGTTAPVISPDIAYDSRNDRYLQVAGNPFIEAHIVKPDGTVLTSFLVYVGNYAQSPRVAYSPDVAGTGGFLVTWNESVATYTRVRGRLFSPEGVALTGPFDIGVNAVSQDSSSNWTMGAPIEYSKKSKEFLVAWMGNYSTPTSANDIFFQRVGITGALLGGNTLVSAGTRAEFDRDPAVAYNLDADEFYIAYAVYAEARHVGFAAGRRVKAGTGAFVGVPQQFAEAVAVYVPSVTYNTAAHQYLLGWYNQTRGGAPVYGVVLNGPDAVPIGDLRVLSAYYSAYDALDIDYNPPSGQYLLVTHGKNQEDAAVSILAGGTAVDNGFLATSTNVTGNFNPRMTASTKDKRWLIVTASGFKATAGQFVGSDATGTPPTPIRRPSDYDGDGHADIVTFRASTGTWNIRGVMVDTWGRPGDLPVPADYNGDGKVDIAVFRPSTGQWWIKGIGVIDYGLPGDIPVPADYDGDGKDDIAIFRPSSGLWFVRGTAGSVHWGAAGDIPVPGDYNGDGRADIAVYRRATGNWWILGQGRIEWGRPGDIPVPGDYNGDGKTDICVYRPSAGLWFGRDLFVVSFGAPGFVPMAIDIDGDGKDELLMFRSATATWLVQNRVTGITTTLTHGEAGDEVTSPALLTFFPVGGDADGDRRADPTIYRPSTSTWWARRSSDGTYDAVSFGLPGDIPVQADYDGDGKLDMAVFRSASGTWYVTQSSTGFSTYTASEPWGIPGDVPLPGDYDGDGRADLVVYRPSTGVWYIRESSTDFATGFSVTWGLPGDIPVPGDFDGDGRLEPAVYRPSLGRWYINDLATGATSARDWGIAGDIPIVADFDGDGVVDLAVYRPSLGRWYVSNSASGSMTVTDWGLATDVPVAADFDGDGHADIAVYRPDLGRWFILNALTGAYSVLDWGIPGDIVAMRRF